jgi:hypothetical protein
MRGTCVWSILLAGSLQLGLPQGASADRHRHHGDPYRPVYGVTVFMPAGSHLVYRYYQDLTPHDVRYPSEGIGARSPVRSELWYRHFQQRWRLERAQSRFEDRLEDRRARFRDADERWYDR